MHIRMAQRALSADARASHLELAALWTRLAAQADHAPPEIPAGLIGPDNLGKGAGEP